MKPEKPRAKLLKPNKKLKKQIRNLKKMKAPKIIKPRKKAAKV